MSRHVGPDESSDDQIALQAAERELRDMRAEAVQLRATVKNLESALRAAGKVLEPYVRRASA